MAYTFHALNFICNCVNISTNLKAKGCFVISVLHFKISLTNMTKTLINTGFFPHIIFTPDDIKCQFWFFDLKSCRLLQKSNFYHNLCAFYLPTNSSSSTFDGVFLTEEIKRQINSSHSLCRITWQFDQFICKCFFWKTKK